MLIYVNRDLPFDGESPPLQGCQPAHFIVTEVYETNEQTRRTRDPLIEKRRERVLDCWSLEIKDLSHLLTLVSAHGCATIEQGVYENLPDEWDLSLWPDNKD